MPLTAQEETQGGSHIELETILNSNSTVALTIESPSVVPDRSEAQTQDLNEGSDEESAGASPTGQRLTCGGEKKEKTGEDVKYGEVNLSSLYRELTVEKMWQERTWFEVLKHFAITLIINVLPTLFDVGTDIYAVLEYLAEGDTFWGWITLVIIFLPGLFFSVWIRKAFKINFCNPSVSCMCCLFHPLSPFGFILFPFILIAVEIVGLFNPGPEWKRFTVKITSFEGDFESSLQMLLSLYIILARAETGVLPKWWQFAQIAASIVMITKTAIADYLLPNQPMSMKEELKATIKLIPLFLSNCVFKVLSFVTSVIGFRGIASFLYPVALVLLYLPNLLSCCCRLPIGYLTMGSPKHMVKLLVIQKGGRTTKQSMNNLLYNNIFWFLLWCTILLPLQIAAARYQTGPEVQEMFYVSCGLILFAVVLNIVLIYFQLWRPFKAKEEREEDIEVGEDGLEEEGSSSACLCIFISFGLPMFCMLVYGIVWWNNNDLNLC